MAVLTIHDTECELLTLGYAACHCAGRAFLADATDEERGAFEARNRIKRIEETA